MDANEVVRAHFRRPRYAGVFAADDPGVVEAYVGEPFRGGVIRLQIKVHHDVIAAVRQQVYGCGFLIAAASWTADWLQTRPLVQAACFDKRVLEEVLQLPPAKLHCAVLAEQAVRQVVQTYRSGALND